MLGAFGAHALTELISAASLSAYKTAVQYQFIHTLAIFALAIALMTSEQTLRAWRIAGIGWMLGIILFCGSLYWLALGGPRWLGPITPIGGLCFIVAWCSFAVGAWQSRL